MKIYKTVFILVFILLASACSKDNDVKTSGTHSISSEKILEGQTYSYYGFSFSKASVKLYNDASSSDRPDFGVGMNQDSLPYFDTENIEESFALAGDFSSADSALAFFNSYVEVDVSSYVGLAQPVFKNQIWIFKTRSSTYGKILILNTINYEKNSHMLTEVEFKWVYQPDGSTFFNK